MHRNTLTTPAGSPSQRYAAPAFKPAHVVCRSQKQLSREEEGGEAVCRRLALTVLVGAVADSSRVSPADAAYGEVSKAIERSLYR